MGPKDEDSEEDSEVWTPQKWSHFSTMDVTFLGPLGKRCFFFENVKVAQKQQLVRIIDWRSFRLQELQCVDLTNTHRNLMKSP